MLQNSPFVTKYYVVSFAAVFEAACGSRRRRLRPVNWTTVRLSSGISANILDFVIPQKHVLLMCGRGNPPQDGDGRGPRNQKQRYGAGALIVPLRGENHGGFLGQQAGACSDSRKRGNESEIRNPADAASDV
jgi:hypothetical protein